MNSKANITGVLILFTILSVSAKIGNVITESWWLVFTPMYALLAYRFTVPLIVLVLTYFIKIFDFFFGEPKDYRGY